MVSTETSGQTTGTESPSDSGGTAVSVESTSEGTHFFHNA